MHEFFEAAVTIGLAIAGVAVVSVLVSRNAQTPAVIQAAASGYSNALDTAISPVTGATTPPVLSYPQTSGFGGFQMPFGNYGGIA